MKKLWGLLPILILAACSKESKSGEDLPVMEFQEYSFNMVGEATVDSVGEALGAPICCEGYGIMPLKIGDNDLQALRDSLGRLGGFVVNPHMQAEPEPIEGIKFRAWKAGDEELESIRTAKLTIAMMTPKIIVWRGYSTEYLSGMAHGMYSTLYLNYSVTENKVLQMSDVLKAEMSPTLLERIRERLRDNEDVFSADNADLPKVFRITPNGITFVYGLYDIAPYSAGEVSIDFDAYELEDLLTPQGKIYFEID